MTDYYEVVNESTLEQGDLLLRCPLPSLGTYKHPLPAEFPIKVGKLDVVVLSQSCDLANDKIDEVLLAAVHSYDQLVAREGDENPALKGKGWRRQAAEGNQPAIAVLPPQSSPPPLPWSLVDFHHLYTAPKQYLESFAEQSGDRLRLVPPYREHLAQAFARYVMRVGLPAPFDDFRNVTPSA